MSSSNRCKSLLAFLIVLAPATAGCSIAVKGGSHTFTSTEIEKLRDKPTLSVWELEFGVRDLCTLQTNERNVRERRRVFFAQFVRDENIQPLGTGWLDSNICPDVLEILQQHLLPVRPPPNPEADRRQCNQQRDAEQATGGRQPAAGRCVVGSVRLGHAVIPASDVP